MIYHNWFLCFQQFSFWSEQQLQYSGVRIFTLMQTSGAVGITSTGMRLGLQILNTTHFTGIVSATLLSIIKTKILGDFYCGAPLAIVKLWSNIGLKWCSCWCPTPPDHHHQFFTAYTNTTIFNCNSHGVMLNWYRNNFNVFFKILAWCYVELI